MFHYPAKAFDVLARAAKLEHRHAMHAKVIFRLGTKCSLQTAECVQNADRECKEIFRVICDNMSSYNLPTVTQSLFRDQLSRLFALSWNIPDPFRDQNRS